MKEQVRRNRDRFLDDFMFELSKSELDDLRCQIGTSKWGGTRYIPFAFTEQGVAKRRLVISKKARLNMAITKGKIE